MSTGSGCGLLCVWAPFENSSKCTAVKLARSVRPVMASYKQLLMVVMVTPVNGVCGCYREFDWDVDISERMMQIVIRILAKK